jgi:hypothetical protein
MNDSMILICVNNRTDDAPAGYDISQVTDFLATIHQYYYNLTIGKSYEMLRDPLSTLIIGKSYEMLRALWMDPLSTLILIQDDFGHIGFFPKHCFKSLDEIRDEKINLILDGNKIK